MTRDNSPKKRRLPLFCSLVFLLAALSALLYFLFTRLPALADFFNRTVSAFGRRIMGYLFSWVLFSVAEMLLLLIPVFVAGLLVLAWKRFCHSASAALRFAAYVLTLPCLVWIIFVWNFAPGYFGSTLDQKLELERTPVSAQELFDTAETLREELSLLEKQVTFLPDGSSLMPYTYGEMNAKLMDAYVSFSQKHPHLIQHFTCPTKPVMLSEPWSYTHITGVYTFFTGESNINVNFPDYTVPYTAAHELAHQRGIAREDEANFVAFLVCMESDDPYIRYSGCLNLYEYVLSALGRANRDLYLQSYSALPQVIRAEEIAYSRFFEKYQDHVASQVAGSVNNSFLQSQGTPGTRSYGMVVDLAVAYYKAGE